MKLSTLKTSFASISKTQEKERKIYTLSGKVVKKDLTKIVRLYSQKTGELLRIGITDYSGNYTFNSIPQESYFVVILDDTKKYNAYAQDNLIPK